MDVTWDTIVIFGCRCFTDGLFSNIWMIWMVFPAKKTTFLAHGDLMRGRLPQSTQGADGLGRSCEFLEVS